MLKDWRIHLSMGSKWLVYRDWKNNKDVFIKLIHSPVVRKEIIFEIEASSSRYGKELPTLFDVLEGEYWSNPITHPYLKLILKDLING